MNQKKRQRGCNITTAEKSSIADVVLKYKNVLKRKEHRLRFIVYEEQMLG